MCGTCGGHGPTPDPVAEPEAESGHHGHEQHVPHDHADGNKGTRIVLAGKGGVGKSTISALLARQLARDGLSVVAVDADEQRNLAATLGIDIVLATAIVAVSEEADYIEEKTGARPGEGAGGMLVLNPSTTDLIDRLSVAAPDGVRLVVMGGVRAAGGGCLCPETALISSAVAEMHLHDDDVVIMDTHAGVEHFGRALARGFDAAVIVVDPTFNSIQVGVESASLARDLGIARVHLAVNRTRSGADLENAMTCVDQLGGPSFDSVTALPYDESALLCEPSVGRLLDGSALAAAVTRLSEAVLAVRPALIGVAR